MASMIDSHPQKNQIVEMMLAGRSLRDIGSSVTPKLSAMALHRYRTKHVGPTLEGAGVLSKALQSLAQSAGSSEPAMDAKEVTRAALLADPLLSRIARHQQTIDSSILDAQATKDGKTVASLVGADFRGIELHARLTGRLEAHQGPSVAIQIVCPAAAGPTTIEPDDGGMVLDIGKR